MSHQHPPPLRFEQHRQGDAVVLRMSGVLLGAAARRARTSMARALAGSPRVVVADLSAVVGADPSGAVLLVAMKRHAHRAGCSFRLAGVDETVRAVLRRHRVDLPVDERPRATGGHGPPGVGYALIARPLAL